MLTPGSLGTQNITFNLRHPPACLTQTSSLAVRLFFKISSGDGMLIRAFAPAADTREEQLKRLSADALLKPTVSGVIATLPTYSWPVG